MSRILLIKPKLHDYGLYTRPGVSKVAPLGLGIIAALSAGHDVKIVDEDTKKVDFSSDADLVGITCMTAQSPRAYRIADRFRELGKKVVMGGVHPSIMTDEALGHCDSVVVGEAEEVWPRLLSDMRENRLKKVYKSSPVDMREVPDARRDLFKSKNFLSPFEVSRGCSNNCEYCYLQYVPWKKWRRKPIEKVYKALKKCSNRYLLLVDECLFTDLNYAAELCEAIEDLNKVWYIQAPVSISREKWLLKKMRKAGCWMVCCGLDSANFKKLHYKKRLGSLSEYREAIARFHKADIFVNGFFMFGFDDDGPDIFGKTLNLIKTSKIDSAIFFILVPYPGTPVFSRLKAQNRILTYDWGKYNWLNAVFRPARMTKEQLEDGTIWAYRELNRYTRKRIPRLLFTKSGLRLAKEAFPVIPRIVKSGLVTGKWIPQGSYGEASV
ncbi:MAG: cobalamin-dependent protein [Elusimicrobia bacterium]|nr:cobalamin-dependent protein [Elusimicrobiota bacterium]